MNVKHHNVMHANVETQQNDGISATDLEKLGNRFLSLITQYNIKDVISLYRDLVQYHHTYNESILDALISLLLEILKRDCQALVQLNDEEIMKDVYGEDWTLITSEMNKIRNYDRIEKQFPVHVIHLNDKGSRQSPFHFCETSWYLKAMRMPEGQFGLFLYNEDIENKGSLLRPINTQVCLGIVNVANQNKGFAYRFTTSWKEVKANGFYDKITVDEILSPDDGWLDDSGTLHVIVEIKLLPSVLTSLDTDMTKSVLELYQLLRNFIEKRYAREHERMLSITDVVSDNLDVHEPNNELIKLREERETMKSIMEKQREDLNKYQIEMRNVKDIHEREVQDRKNMRDYCESLKRQIADCTEENERLKQEIQKLTTQIEIIAVQLKETSKRFSEEKSRITSEKEQLLNQFMHIEKAHESQIKDITLKKNQLENENKNLTEQLGKSIARISTYESNMERIRKHAEEIKKITV